MKPDIENEVYGPNDRNKFDLYLAKSDTPTPLLFFVHGGGFMNGDKDAVLGCQIPVEDCLSNGISVSSIQYRLTDAGPFPMQMHDSAAALQYIRHNAAQWNIDPSRVAACGPSAGAGISQWLAFHADLARLEDADPVKRQSTRVKCAILLQGQSTYDPRLMKTIVPGDAYNHTAMKRLFGVGDDFNWDEQEIPEEALARIEECGPITHLSADAPPILGKYRREHEVPGQVHHPNLGHHLKEAMDKLGLDCTIRLDDEYDAYPDGFYTEFMEFLGKHL